MPSGAVYLLHPGDVVCAERGDTLETLLGSCIAVLLSDRKRTIAAMCHIVHCRPSLNTFARATAAAAITRTEDCDGWWALRALPSSRWMCRGQWGITNPPGASSAEGTLTCGPNYHTTCSW
jgi:hypothetical protein